MFREFREFRGFKEFRKFRGFREFREFRGNSFLYWWVGSTSPRDPTSRWISKDRNNYFPVQISRTDGHRPLLEVSVKANFDTRLVNLVLL